MTQPAHELTAISAGFGLPGQPRAAEPWGSGHINDTFKLAFPEGDVILQRINHHIFKEPAALMRNIERVLRHLRSKKVRSLELLHAQDGAPFLRDAAGNYWRAYRFIEGGRTYDVVESERHAFEAGRAFGAFQSHLADLPAPRLHDTIPGFHDTLKRFAAFADAAKQNGVGRAKAAAREIEFALSRKETASLLDAPARRGELPERIAHNDTKFNNVIIDQTTQEALCVVDLDTVMPGLVLHDFGDMVRTTTCTAAEDERDLSKIEVSLPHFEALARGYLSAAGGFLNAAEKAHLAVAGKVITFELGLRFLTDHLEGDTYFKVHHPDHNLERARSQFKLVESLEIKEDGMRRVVEGLS